MELEMDMANSNGLMVPNILDNGKMIKLTEKENSFMEMEIFMKVFNIKKINKYKIY